jgi:omega-6 fatty acid desaturase / acyl-lipid omega-6 desaturase (Delta-12 desaturase)
MTQDQVFVPKTRSEMNLPKFNQDGEELLGSRITEEVMGELKEAIGDSPLGATIGFFSYLVCFDSRHVTWKLLI